METILPALFRRVRFTTMERERIDTPDGDFLDLDWARQNSNKLIIISHGLEGNSGKPYVRGMARAFYSVGYDILAWNYRGCSGEVNRKLRFYHSGATDDLAWVISQVAHHYEAVYLIGFSLGGNLTLKYLGEGNDLPTALKGAVAISVPLDLHSSCQQISQPGNRVYANRFLRNLKKKVRQKARLMPELPTNGLEKIANLIDFDNRYTAPIHGFNDAIDYYTQCSAIHYLNNITIPTLILNAQNDPFLSDKCYPVDMLADHRHVRLEAPDFGGHVGFSQFNNNGLFWSEQRAVDFINDIKAREPAIS